LEALCSSIDGSKKHSSIDITSYDGTETISNINGVLTKDKSSGAVSSSFVPHGSYAASSSNISVKLHASCKNFEGKFVDNVVDITHLDFNKLLTNKNGHLVN